MAKRTNPEPASPQTDDSFRVRTVRLNVLVSGLAAGLLCGLGLAAATAILVTKGGDPVGPHLSLLNQFFWGYSVTWTGVVIGFLYAAATGFVCGSAVALLYNALARNNH